MNKIGLSGSFDPITNGHLWLIKEASKMADNVIVFIAQSNNKNSLLSKKTKKELIEEVLLENNLEKKVSVEIIENEYLAIKAKELNVDYLLRGIRNTSDFEYENKIDNANTKILNGIKTIFLIPPKELEHISSSFVKSIMGPIGWQWYLKELVPKPVLDALIKIEISNKIKEFLPLLSENIIDTMFLYQEENRYYHNLEHILHCLQELYKIKDQIKHEEYKNLFIAILFHDIVYKSKQTESDEKLSVDLMKKTIETIDTLNIENLILATQHFSKHENLTFLEKIMIDIDLSILSKEESIYNKYSNNIRKEYAEVADKDYSSARIKALEFLLNKQIYLTSFFEKNELMAKENVKREINKLKEQQ